ncbi:mitochondrial PGP phosphatase [Cercophora scortea]|uniref:Mitochondrial PGP phosphatase n=1 Tax=Cercophora scortea TaxID=314031 RepID=A0AAE0MDP2_9PEZI|nr:mitochondrial PGP phosphatase [Cercophora scortea]
MNLNLSASLNIFKLLARPSLCLPHATVPTFDDLPLPLDKAFAHAQSQGQSEKRQVDIKAVVLDKDDCFAYPDSNEVHGPYKQRFEALRALYPGRRLLIVSNTAGSSYDADGKMAVAVEKATGVAVLSHRVKKPGCGSEIMAYFREHPETGVTSPSHIAIVGDRLATDMMLANAMGSWGLWVKDGVVPLQQKSIFSRVERNLAPFLLSRGYSAPVPTSPFE